MGRHAKHSHTKRQHQQQQYYSASRQPPITPNMPRKHLNFTPASAFAPLGSSPLFTPASSVASERIAPVSASLSSRVEKAKSGSTSTKLNNRKKRAAAAAAAAATAAAMAAEFGTIDGEFSGGEGGVSAGADMASSHHAVSETVSTVAAAADRFAFHASGGGASLLPPITPGTANSVDSINGDGEFFADLDLGVAASVRLQRSRSREFESDSRNRSPTKSPLPIRVSRASASSSWSITGVVSKGLRAVGDFLLARTDAPSGGSPKRHFTVSELTERILQLESEMSILRKRVADQPLQDHAPSMSNDAFVPPPPPMPPMCMGAPPPPPPPLPPLMMPKEYKIVLGRASQKTQRDENDGEASGKKKAKGFSVSLEDIQRVALRRVSSNQSVTTPGSAPASAKDITSALAMEAKAFQLKRNDSIRSPGGTPMRPRKATNASLLENAGSDASHGVRTLLRRARTESISSPVRHSPFGSPSAAVRA
ncbi:hypothetical protein CAOG_07623 [Capsaspora owczarzaki ATCC 30864]|uniref:Uncharacterized protein n=1 Tax=Capsaspora owczarzaki (strain ATCC 30864) TaxID=595528 RepID=A0A0D2WWY8_CAPO3|nr:hypothetical protein CAOG_07623 [Capsaspora owczarzaki ATCC 30864]KJE97173.1 hypothetical protein CAOG_007623 [Capsaspora owczarzaki ATCC 30864]|eukprot:XP_004343497.2 hypothetical protein CAOG_07623 [Capsaspora owczarzaki ATCC 30864]